MFKIFSLLVSFFISISSMSTAFAATTLDLQKAIDDKNNELINIKNQIQQTQDKLEEVAGQGRTLNQEVKKLDYSVNQLNLGIKLSETNSEKLGLEINSLQDKKVETESSIDVTKEAISKVIRELQRKENDNLVQIILRNASLSDGILEIQSLKDLQGNLAVSSAQLGKFSEDLGNNINETSQKKSDLERESLNLKTKKVLVSEEKQNKTTLLKQTKYQESLYQKQLQDLLTQQNSLSDQIDSIEDELKKQLGSDFVAPKILGFFLWPITKEGSAGRTTQHFGEKSRLYRGRPHNGLDVSAPIGTPILAVTDGVVKRVDNNDRSAWAKYQYGKYVVIDHGNNISTLYAHLSKQLVGVGEKVRQGDVIGYSGKTGYATGPHLHLGVYLTNTMSFKPVSPAAGLVPIGVVLNPEDYF